MRQAILTKYHGPTNTRGSRISAACERGRITLEWDDAENSETNHILAAQALCAKFVSEDKHRYRSDERNPWSAAIASGMLPTGHGCHVLMTRA